MADRSASLPTASADALVVPWPRVEGFVGQLTHDIRNGFNAMELQVTLIGELSNDPEIKEEVKRVRQSLAELTRQLQAIRTSTAMPTAHLFPYPVGDFLEDMRERFQRRPDGASSRVQWVSGSEGASTVNIDPEQAMSAMLELVDNAVRHAVDGSSVRVEATSGAGSVTVAIHQQLAQALPVSPEDWGRTPLLSSRRNAYGLGAFRARRILELQGGSLEYRYAEVDRSLVTAVTLPLATADEEAG